MGSSVTKSSKAIHLTIILCNEMTASNYAAFINYSRMNNSSEVVIFNESIKLV